MCYLHSHTVCLLNYTSLKSGFQMMDIKPPCQCWLLLGFLGFTSKVFIEKIWDSDFLGDTPCDFDAGGMWMAL